MVICCCFFCQSLIARFYFVPLCTVFTELHGYGCHGTALVFQRCYCFGFMQVNRNHRRLFGILRCSPVCPVCALFSVSNPFYAVRLCLLYVLRPGPVITAVRIVCICRDFHIVRGNHVCFHRPCGFVQHAVCLDFDRSCIHSIRIIQVFIHSPYFIIHHPVIDCVYRIGKYRYITRFRSRHKSDNTLLMLSIPRQAAGNLIAVNQVFVLRCTNRYGYLVCTRLCLCFCRQHAVLIQHCSGFIFVVCTVFSDCFVYIVNGFCFLLVFFRISNGVFIRLHSPAFEKCQDIFVSCRTR